MMKGRSTTLVVVAALAAVGVGYAATSPDGLPRHDSVFGGGHFAFGTGRSFSLTASEGTGTLNYGVARIRAEITCLTVTGNTAVVGGVIRDSTDESFVGDPVLMYFVDNGPPNRTDVGGDTVSPLNVFGPD